MRAIWLALIISFLAGNSIAQPEDVDDPYRERLGIRAGYTATTSGLDDTFGSGLDLALHFLQRITYPLSVDIVLGAFYLGGTDRDDITFDIFRQSFDDVSMRVIRFTVAPRVEFHISERSDLYASAGAGLYAISVLLDENIFEFDVTDNHFGVNLGGGLVRRLTTNWFLEIDVSLHKFWTAEDSDDLFFRYSEGDSDPLFYQVDVGAMLRLF